MASILIAGIGNEYRGDDAVGLIVVRELSVRHIPGVECIECTGGLDLLEQWQADQTVILIDAVVAGGTLGSIYRVDLLHEPIPPSFGLFSTHALGIAEAIELARTLQQLPARLILYAIEGARFTVGSMLSSEVEHAVQMVVEQVMAEIVSL